MSRIRHHYALIAGMAALAILAGCEPAEPTSTQRNAAQVESNQQRLMSAIPNPRLETSLERKNLVERLERINQQNMSGYIYLLSYGNVVAEYPIRGKVTSLKSYLMAGDAPQKFSVGGTTVLEMVEQPDYDGAYGENTEGIFFFTADTNAYVEWHGDYLFSDQPLRLSQRPMMVRNVADD
ncbi:hypothetical protein [Shinella zoogloeoides]|uniref:hypothetical protein n=1 Tax=Shinella zoogloeoides TaxID=352475 RepID=UPI00273FFCAD|nr:hypothetical protein [Shinella zoogloeoides]WLR90926.1 hypothetical protein Q9316_00685 [Shinella zoogloeoides]